MSIIYKESLLIKYLLYALTVIFIGLAVYFFPEAQKDASEAYRTFPVIGSRVAVWIVAQLHLYLAAFMLAIPMFAVIIEYIGHRTGDKRYDTLAHDFTRLLVVSSSLTAGLGGILTFLLVFLYPNFTHYMTKIFGLTYLPYIILVLCEITLIYTYYYGWNKFSKRTHLTIGLGLNIAGTMIILIANAWVTFMMSPGGINPVTGGLESLWGAISNFTWMPINIHRLIANVAFGGAVAAAYGAFKFLGAKTDEERARYDWTGYIGNFVAIIALLPLPFAGYWLGFEIYEYHKTLGMNLMGDIFSWLFIIQAILIGMLFIPINYYFWLGMRRIEGAERYYKFVKYLLFVATLCFLVWAIPHTMVLTPSETRIIPTNHPLVGPLGLMSAKNTAVNILILTTFISFLLYRRGNKIPTVTWAKVGHLAQLSIFVIATIFVIAVGILGYAGNIMESIGSAIGYAASEVRIKIFSPLQVVVVLLTMISVTFIDVKLFKNAKIIGKIKWGKISDRSQYILFFLAITYTWLMGLMGYARSGIRQHWHVYAGKLKPNEAFESTIMDSSVDAVTPTLGDATFIVSITVILFFGLIALVFWLASTADKKTAEQTK